MRRRPMICCSLAVPIVVVLGASARVAAAADTVPMTISGECEIAQSPSESHTLVSVVGCVYDSRSGRKIEGPFVIRTFTRSGSGGASLQSAGCYDGIGLGDPSPDAWDFIEVLYRENGRIYSQQRKLPSTASPAGFNFLGVAENTLRYDFYLDVVRREGPHVDAIGEEAITGR